MNIKDIFYELINETKNGQMIIDGDNFPIGFNTIIYDDRKTPEKYIGNDNFPTLEINNLNLFFKKLEEYLLLEKDKNRKSYNFLKNKPHEYYKLLIGCLFTNATTEDFRNPISFIDKEIAFLNDTTFNYLNNGISFELGSNFKDSKLEIKNESQSIMMETPYKMTFKFTKIINDKLVSYQLPTISYGIKENDKGEKECYVYSILNSETKESNNEDEKEFKKKISRLLYKVNKNVHDESEESINDVSPSAVIALSIFMSLLKKENITIVKGVPYLPLRYLSRDIMANDLSKKERNDNIQTNLTNKFIRTFNRVAYHTNGIEINSYPYEYDEYLNVKLNNINEINNDLLDEINKKIK